jgi:(R,R)-butanediol dehydrogenase / meso-butanediol dehydrogenase / diacetyl reductase
MKAAVYNGPNNVEVADVPEPRLAPGTVKVKVGFTGICGTDLHERGVDIVPTDAHRHTGQQLPLTLGHEFSGVITGIGAGIAGWAEGDRVAVEPIYKCGHCASCTVGNHNICAQIGFHGVMSDGGMAEFCVVPAGMLHKLPDSVSLQLGALVEPMSVAYHAATLGDAKPGDTAMVFGAGPIGIGLWFALRDKGIEDLFVIEPSAPRRAAIERLGACTLDPAADDVPAFIAGHTGGRGADAVFDAAGATTAVKTALACVGARRPMISVAIYEKPLTTPLVNLAMEKSWIHGSLCYSAADFEAVIALMARGAYDTTGWVTPIALDDVIDEGFEAVHAGKKMKVLVDPSI